MYTLHCEVDAAHLLLDGTVVFYGQDERVGTGREGILIDGPHYLLQQHTDIL